MKITLNTPGHEHIVALDNRGAAIGYLSEIDTEEMVGYRIGKIYDKEPGPSGVRFFEPVDPNDIGVKYPAYELHREVHPIKISELIDRRTGKPWVPSEE